MLVLSGLLKLQHVCKSPGACYSAASDAVGWGWGLRFCSSNKLSGAVPAAGPSARLGIARLYFIIRLNFSSLSQNCGCREPWSKPFPSHVSNVGDKEFFFHPFAHTPIYQNTHSGSCALLIWVAESSADALEQSKFQGLLVLLLVGLCYCFLLPDFMAQHFVN